MYLHVEYEKIINKVINDRPISITRVVKNLLKEFI